MKTISIKDMICLSKFEFNVYLNRNDNALLHFNRANKIGLYRYGDSFIVSWYIIKTHQREFDTIDSALEFYNQQIINIFSVL